MSGGLDNLILMSKEVQQKVFQVTNKAGGGGGGVGSGDGKKWRVGELEFEGWMRLLDNMVTCLVLCRLATPLHVSMSVCLSLSIFTCQSVCLFVCRSAS